MENNILTKDIANHFNRELEKNIKNALYNLGIEFENDYDFYNFISENIIKTEENDRDSGRGYIEKKYSGKSVLTFEIYKQPKK